MHQINWSLAQRLRAPLRLRLWIAPANHFLCLVAKTPAAPASFCAPTSYALAHGLPATFLRAPGGSWPEAEGSRLIVGIAPDQARRILIQTHSVVTSVPVDPDGVFILQDSLNAPPDRTVLQRGSRASRPRVLVQATPERR